MIESRMKDNDAKGNVASSISHPIKGRPINTTSIGIADVRIVMIGDSNVGKTTLLQALFDDEFTSEVEECLDTVIIPADVTPEKVITAIADTSLRCYTEEQICSLLQKANVVCIVYDTTDDESIVRVTTYWLPLLRKEFGDDHDIPVILVGNKSDDVDNHTDQVLPIMERWNEIETCVESSAKILKNVSEIFYYAQKAVVYPTRPLYDADGKQLTEKARKALIRVFKICDHDNDGLLDDKELNAFQMLCFNLPLTGAAVKDVKRAVSVECKDGVVKDSLSLPGFLFLNYLFIQRGRHETTWTILRRFGYGENLSLSPSYVYPRISVPPGCSTELSVDGMAFVTSLFDKYDENKDGCLDPSELKNLFSVCTTAPISKEILASVETNAKGWLTLTGYISYWHMTVLLQVSLAFEQLAYLGYSIDVRSQKESPLSLESAIRITRERRVDLLEKSTDRNVFQCLVVGAKDVGKTVFMQSLAGRGLADVVRMARRHSPYVINRVKVKDYSKYLLLREVDMLDPSDVLSGGETSADVVALLYDASNADSFAFCATIFLKHFHRTKTPCIMIATKVERDFVEQRYDLQPEEFCRQYELPKPLRFSKDLIGDPNGAIFVQLATMACYPHLRRIFFLHDANMLSKITFTAALAALAGFLVYRNL